jgi:hypothetical protein
MKVDEKRKTIAITLSEPVFQKIEEDRKRLGFNRSYFIEFLLREHYQLLPGGSRE